jgi:hypothetical protein
MKNLVIRSIINNTFLPNYQSIMDYFDENNLVYNNEDKIDGGFTLNFSGNDSKKLFEKNLKTQPNDWYYRTHEVKYTLNSLGYRTKEFDDIDWKESIVMFGCSIVFGTGVTDKHTIPYFLEQLSGRPVINMGVAGSSIQHALHNSIILNDSEYSTPKAVVYSFTDLRRFQLYKNNLIQHNVPGWLTTQDIEGFSSTDNAIPFNLMNVKMIRNLWKNKTIYYEASAFSQEKLFNKLSNEICCECLYSLEVEDQFARDMSHFSYMTNMNLAKQIYSSLKPQLLKTL